MKCIFLYNPALYKLKANLPFIIRELNNKFTYVSVLEVISSEMMKEEVNRACGSYDVICFGGGDGTFNLVTNEILKYEKRPILAYIPSGTANDIASNLKIPKNIKKALKVICRREPIYHDVGKVNDQYFVYVCGAGTFTSVSYSTKKKAKKIFGILAYALQGVKELNRPTIVKGKVDIDGITLDITCPLVLIANSCFIGGRRFNKRGHQNDGKFDIILCKKQFTNIFSITKLVMIGTYKKNHTKYYDFYRASNIKITPSSDVVWCIDGEKGPSGEINIQNIHQQIQVFVSKKGERYENNRRNTSQ